MRKLFRRIALPMLLTALISGTAATIAHADPAYPSETRCQDWMIGTSVRANVCLTKQGFDYGAYYEWHATTYLYNLTSQPVPVTSRVDIVGNRGTIKGTTRTTTIPAGTSPEFNSLGVPYDAAGLTPWSNATITTPETTRLVSSLRF